MRHLTESKGHAIALEKERSLDEDKRTVEDIAQGPSQPRIDHMITKVSHDAHRKLLVTAYELAITPTMPLRHFSVLVNVQRQNGVQVIEGMVPEFLLHYY